MEAGRVNHERAAALQRRARRAVRRLCSVL